MKTRLTAIGLITFLAAASPPLFAQAYTKPFTVRVDQRIMVDDEMIEFICAENEKSVAHMVGK
jgi:hypothetical protein